MKILILAVLFQAAACSQVLAERHYLTGNWWGCRDSLNSKGISFEFDYTADFFSNIKGGLNKSSVYLDDFDMILTLDLEKLLAVSGTNLFIYGLGNDGGNPDQSIGDVQGVSSITAPNSWKLYEAWIQTNLFDHHLSILAGLYDLNSEFENLATSNLFINASHGIGIGFAQTGEMGPSIFPWTSAGVRIKSKLSEKFYLQAAILDGIPGDPNDLYGTHIIFSKNDGLLITFETGTTEYSKQNEKPPSSSRIGRFASEKYDYKYSLGFWKYTSEFKRIDSPLKSRNNIGAYISGEQNLYEQKGSGRILSAFIRFEAANAEINRFAYYAGCGFVYSSPFNGRPDDEAGIALAAAINGNPYERALQGNNMEDAEYNIELTYFAQLLPWFTLQPDLQYIIYPDTNPEIPNALVFGLRLGIQI